MLVDLAVREIIAVILPVGQADRAVDLEQRRRIALFDLGHERGFILAGSSGDDGHRHAGLLGVERGELLPLRVLLGLEVQVVDGAICGGRNGQGQAQARHDDQSDDFLHTTESPSNDIDMGSPAASHTHGVAQCGTVCLETSL